MDGVIITAIVAPESYISDTNNQIICLVSNVWLVDSKKLRSNVRFVRRIFAQDVKEEEHVTGGDMELLNRP